MMRDRVLVYREHFRDEPLMDIDYWWRFLKQHGNCVIPVASFYFIFVYGLVIELILPDYIPSAP